MSTEKNKSSSSSSINRRKEFRLELPLPAKVAGKLANGHSFTEETQVENISSVGAYFGLDALVTVGTKLQIIAELPSNLTEGKKLKLNLAGQIVRLEMSETKRKKQGVALTFDEEIKDEEFQFISETN